MAAERPTGFAHVRSGGKRLWVFGAAQPTSLCKNHSDLTALWPIATAKDYMSECSRLRNKHEPWPITAEHSLAPAGKLMQLYLTDNDTMIGAIAKITDPVLITEIETGKRRGFSLLGGNKGQVDPATGKQINVTARGMSHLSVVQNPAFAAENTYIEGVADNLPDLIRQFDAKIRNTNRLSSVVPADEGWWDLERTAFNSNSPHKAMMGAKQFMKKLESEYGNMNSETMIITSASSSDYPMESAAAPTQPTQPPPPPAENPPAPIKTSVPVAEEVASPAPKREREESFTQPIPDAKKSAIAAADNASVPEPKKTTVEPTKPSADGDALITLRVSEAEAVKQRMVAQEKRLLEQEEQLKAMQDLQKTVAELKAKHEKDAAEKAEAEAKARNANLSNQFAKVSEFLTAPEDIAKAKSIYERANKGEIPMEIADSFTHLTVSAAHRSQMDTKKQEEQFARQREQQQQSAATPLSNIFQDILKSTPTLNSPTVANPPGNSITTQPIANTSPLVFPLSDPPTKTTPTPIVPPPMADITEAIMVTGASASGPVQPRHGMGTYVNQFMPHLKVSEARAALNWAIGKESLYSPELLNVLMDPKKIDYGIIEQAMSVPLGERGVLTIPDAPGHGLPAHAYLSLSQVNGIKQNRMRGMNGFSMTGTDTPMVM